MNIRKILQQMAYLVLVMVFLVGCDTPAATPVPPTTTPTSVPPTPTLRLTFDGESCTYQGPTTLKAGHVTLLFLNESEGQAAVNLVRHTGEETIQDMIDIFREEPSTEQRPSWTIEIQGVWKSVSADESHTWEGVLEPGIHTMVCARLVPLGVWFGTGLTVED